MCGSSSFERAGLAAVLLFAVSAVPVSAQRGPARDRLVEKDPNAAPVARLLEKLGPDVQTFNKHLVTLSNPFMEGRVPGSRGMEIAREYFEFYLKAAGTLPAFPVEGKEGVKSYRQPWEMRGQTKAARQELAVADAAFASGTDFNVLRLGDSGDVKAPVAFVGYAVEEGPDDYTSYPENEQLEGKIAMILRWEPVDAEGKSQWGTDRRPWSRNHSLVLKVRSVRDRGAVGVIFVDGPVVADKRSERLVRAAGGGRKNADFPVVHMSRSAADRLLDKIAPDGPSLGTLAAAANEKGGVMDFAQPVTIGATLETVPLIPANVGGALPGRGALKDEWVVIGGHLDHLGVGLYGARDRSRVGQLHPGADDNASGSAAVLMLADKLVKSYEELPEGQAARSILFIGFDAEEAGLHGARYYTNNPIAPIEKHALMINFDMIGRIVNKRLSVQGSRSAVGMEEWLKPIFDESPIDVVEAPIPGGSDHMMFMSKRVPYLFAIIADFHMDYHTPDDVSWKINREDAVRTIDMFHQIGLAAATHTEPFEWNSNQRTGRRRR